MDLQETIRLHKMWREGIEGGCRADLCGADLYGANLLGANLCGANLRDANLCHADLRDADLRDANLCRADLRDADLRDADLRDANLCDANLSTRYISISQIGSRKGMTTYSFAENKIWCGCFTGTLEEFNAKVIKTYPEASNQYHREYIGFIKYLESLKEG